MPVFTGFGIKIERGCDKLGRDFGDGEILLQSSRSQVVESLDCRCVIQRGKEARQYGADAEHWYRGIKMSRDAFDHSLIFVPSLIAVQRSVHVHLEKLDEVPGVCDDARLGPY